MKKNLRLYVLMLVLFLVVSGSVLRMFDLAILNRSFLMKQSNMRAFRQTEIPAHRGMIVDRNGLPLAISTPVQSVWINPQMFSLQESHLNRLAEILHGSMNHLRSQLNRPYAHFVYLARNVDPVSAQKIKELNIPGVFFQEEYKRYYPKGEIAAHLVGMTNVDDRGQEGLELAFDAWLRGKPGLKNVIKDGLGHTIAEFDQVKAPQKGHDLILSIDQRIQYLAYRELENGIHRYQAQSGSIVVLSVKTGEVLAIVNHPSYNPNSRLNALNLGLMRNRAITDSFEPGSTIKTFSVASALESGRYEPGSLIDTNPGWIKVNGNIINDRPHSNLGLISVTQVLQKSSNIGVSKMTMSLPAQHLVNFLRAVGFGESTGSYFPGEISGSIVTYRNWRPFDLATLSFGYGISVSALQLAKAYAVIANLGVKKPITLLKIFENLNQGIHEQGERVVSQRTAQRILHMLTTVVMDPGGTGSMARVSGYQIAGKTGTAYISGRHGYHKNQYTASFVGIAPASHPLFVVAVILRNPNPKEHLGGAVAAPIFQKVMEGLLRLYNVPPDGDSKQ